MKWSDFVRAIDEEIARIGTEVDPEINWIDVDYPSRKALLTVTITTDGYLEVS